ncbi:MAG: bifunctional nicotinamidase/pyrazinamidase [Verrucomicrobiae bacterium]|nr:bifunctional nicotinamidase/pyrazinamidase [Verrucomicrobiae bacterium]
MKALIIVDMQNDFMPGGPLAVPEADHLVPLINELQKAFEVVVATRDWHPEGHCSFVSNHSGKSVGAVIKHEGLDQILWPQHCVQNTSGAELVDGLDQDRINKVFDKGVDADIDSYSAFYDNGHRRATGLGDYLKDKGVDEVFIVGVATDVCIKFTAIDAARDGFISYVLQDGVRGVELQDGDVEKAFDEMRKNGIRIMQSAELVRFA